MTPEVKIILRVHEDALATAPTLDALKAMLGFEPSLFVVDRQTISVQRSRAPEIQAAESLDDLLRVWLEATGTDLGERSARLAAKLAEVEG